MILVYLAAILCCAMLCQLSNIVLTALLLGSAVNCTLYELQREWGLCVPYRTPLTRRGIAYLISHPSSSGH
jgi:hypothetical protein